MGLQSHLITNEAFAGALGQTFIKVAAQVVELERSRVFAGEVAKMSVRNFEYRLNSMILPAFGPRLISEITGEQIHLLYQRLIAKGLASISVAQYLQDLKKIFNYAYAHSLIDRIPYFPKVKKTSVPRGGFTVSEYRQLVVAAKQLSLVQALPADATHRNTAGGVYTKTDGIPAEIVWARVGCKTGTTCQAQNNQSKKVVSFFHNLKMGEQKKMLKRYKLQSKLFFQQTS